MKRAAVLGVDLGTQSTKASLIGLDGELLASHSVSVGFSRLHPGWGEQPPSVLENSALEAIAGVRRAHPGAQVLALALAGQMGGAVGVDADFRPLTPHELWLDTRADEDRTELLARFGPEILAKNGIIPYVAPRVQPELAATLARVVSPTGYVVGRLTSSRGRDAVCDRTQAHLFGCFDAVQGEWDFDLAARLGFPPHLLPRVADAVEIVGGLSESAAGRCGLSAGTLVAAGLGDGTGGWLAAGGVTPGVCVDTGGSSAHFAITVDRFTPDPTGVLTCMPSPVRGLWYLLGFTTGTGLAQRWLRDLLAHDYAALERLAAAAPPGAGGLLAIGHLTGRASPFAPQVKGAFVGFDDQSGPGHFYRALLESTAYELHAWMRHALTLRPELRLAEATSVGGGAQSDVWGQIKADVTGLAFTTAAPHVNAARGAALVAAAAVGAASLTDERWRAARYLQRRRFTPHEGAFVRYAPYRAQYEQLFERLAPTFEGLARARVQDDVGTSGAATAGKESA